MLMALASIIMLVLMLAINDSLQRFQRDSAESYRRHLTTLVRAQLEQDAEIVLGSASHALSEDLHGGDLPRLQRSLHRNNFV